MKLSTLDRYVLLDVALLRWAVLLFLGTFLLMLGEFIGQVGQNIQLLRNQHFDLLVRYYLLRFPEFLLVWLPLSVPGAAILTAVPLMRQRTIIALSAAGIAPRRVFASLIPLAVLCGVLGFMLKDQIVPRLQSEIEYVQALMYGRVIEGQVFTRPAGWRSGGTHWSVQAALPAINEYRTVAAFHQGARYDDDVSLLADRLVWHNGGWQLEGVTRIVHGQLQRIPACRPEVAGVELHFQPQELALTLRSDDAKTVDEIHAGKGTRYKQVMALRIAAAFLPLICLLFALPSFIRQQSGRVGTATATSLSLAFLPLVAIGLLAKLMVSASLHPVWLAALMLLLLLSIGGWQWWRMRL